MKRINIQVITRAKKEGVQKLSEDSYKVKVSAAPERGKANKKVIELLAEEFGVKRRDVRITAGETSNKKVAEII